MQRLSRRSQRGASILAALVFVAILASVGLFVQSFSPQVNSRALTASGATGSWGTDTTATPASPSSATDTSTNPDRCTILQNIASGKSSSPSNNGGKGLNLVLNEAGNDAAQTQNESAPITSAQSVENKCYSVTYTGATQGQAAVTDMKDPSKYVCHGADATIMGSVSSLTAIYIPDTSGTPADPGHCTTRICPGDGQACYSGSTSLINSFNPSAGALQNPAQALQPPPSSGGAPGAQGLNTQYGNLGDISANPNCDQTGMQYNSGNGCVSSADLQSLYAAGTNPNNINTLPVGSAGNQTCTVAGQTGVGCAIGDNNQIEYYPGDQAERTALQNAGYNCPSGSDTCTVGAPTSPGGMQSPPGTPPSLFTSPATGKPAVTGPGTPGGIGNTFGGNPLSSLLGGLARGLGTPPPPPPPPPPQAPAQACSTDPNAYAQQQQQYQQQMQQYNYQLQQYQYQIQMQQYQQTYGTGNTSPYGSPYGSAYGSPYGTAYGSPYASPYSSPYGYASPYGSPYGSAYGSPYATAYGSPYSSPYGYASPYSSPYGSAYGSPYSSGYGSSYGYPPQPPQQCTPSTQQQCQTQPPQPPASSCTGAAWQPVRSGSCITNWQCGSGVAPVAQLSCQPQIADVGMSIAFTYSCSSGIASSSAFAVSGPSGSATTVVTAPPQGMNTVTYSVGCISGAQVSSAMCSVQVNQPSILLTANPQTVPQGATSVLGWITTGMSSCTVSSSDQSGFTAANAYNTSANGTALTLPMSGSATFDLHCTTAAGGTKDASVTVTSDASSSSATGNATSSVAVSTTADGSTVDHGGSMTIAWNTTNQPSGAAVSLWLNDSTGKVVALIAGDQPLSGSYVWHVPAATSTCPTGGSENVCGADLSAGSKYQVEADVYAPSGAYVGDGAVPSNPTLPTYIDYSPAGLFTVGQ